MLVSSEGPLVDSQYGTIDGASVLHIFQTVNKERNNGSNGTKEETEHGGNEKSHVSVLVDNHGGHLVTLRTWLPLGSAQTHEPAVGMELNTQAACGMQTEKC